MDNSISYNICKGREENGARLALDSESCHRNGSSPTLEKTNIERASSQMSNGKERGPGFISGVFQFGSS